MLNSNTMTRTAAVTFLLAASLVAAAPAAPERRQNTAAKCTTYATGYLGVEMLNPSCDDPDDEFIYAGIVSGATQSGIDGLTNSLLVTSDGSGNALPPQLWEFAECSYLEASGTTEVLGVLRPASATTHCIAPRTTNILVEGARNSLVDSVCANIDEDYTTWRYQHEPDNVGSISFLGSDLTFTIANTGHNELQTVANNATFAETEDAYGLYLLNVTYMS